jgi:predicted MFS family arabinose efflux permease
LNQAECISELSQGEGTKHMEHENKLWNQQYIFLIFVGTLTATSFSMIMPTISKYATQIGASLTVAGIIAGLFSITALIARPFGGVLVDKLNKKMILIIATTILAASTLGYSFSNSIPLLIGFRIIHGIGFAISSTANMALVTTFIPINRMGEGIGYYGLGQIIATAVGPNLGIIIGNAYGFPTTFLISSIIIFIAAALMTRITYRVSVTGINNEKLQRGKILLQDLIATKVLPLALIGGIFSLSNGIVSSFLILLGEARNIRNITFYFTINAICLVIIRPTAGRLSDKKGLSFILYPAFILMTIESLLLSNVNALWIVLVAATCKAFGQGSAQPALQTACIKKVGLSRSGIAISTFYIGADIGQGFGPMIGGVISANFGYNVMFYCCAGLFILGMIAYYIYDRNDKKGTIKTLLTDVR